MITSSTFSASSVGLSLYSTPSETSSFSEEPAYSTSTLIFERSISSPSKYSVEKSDEGVTEIETGLSLKRIVLLHDLSS